MSGGGPTGLPICLPGRAGRSHFLMASMLASPSVPRSSCGRRACCMRGAWIRMRKRTMMDVTHRASILYHVTFIDTGHTLAGVPDPRATTVRAPVIRTQARKALQPDARTVRPPLRRGMRPPRQFCRDSRPGCDTRLISAAVRHGTQQIATKGNDGRAGQGHDATQGARTALSGRPFECGRGKTGTAGFPVSPPRRCAAARSGAPRQRFAIPRPSLCVRCSPPRPRPRTAWPSAPPPWARPR